MKANQAHNKIAKELSLTCFVTESISLTYKSCSCRTPEIQQKNTRIEIWTPVQFLHL